MSRTARLFLLMDALRAKRRPVTAADLGRAAGRVRTDDLPRHPDPGRARRADRGRGGHRLCAAQRFLMPPLMFGADELEALVLGARWVQAPGRPGAGRGGLERTGENRRGGAERPARRDGRYQPVGADRRHRRSRRRVRPAGARSDPPRTQAVHRLSGRGRRRVRAQGLADSRWPSSKASGCWPPGANCAPTSATSASTGSARRARPASATDPPPPVARRSGAGSKASPKTPDKN